jgi:epoxyqueuosine reductase
VHVVDAGVNDLNNLTARVKLSAGELGFDLVGVAPAVTPETYPEFVTWLEQGYAGEMAYLPQRQAAYAHPEHVLAGVRSVVLVGLNYQVVPSERNRAPLTGRIASYAQGTTDYHDVMKTRLQQLAIVLHQHVPGCRTRAVVDTAPLLERDFARRAGLGWFGKNTMLIHKRLGSYLFLGALLTDVELSPDPPHATSHCGTCTACLDQCPTAAFPEPGVLDARRCIAYLTIELRTPIPTELRSGMGDWLFGCDVCQEVCPWNRKSPRGAEPAFAPSAQLGTNSSLRHLLTTDDALLKQEFRGTAFARTGPVGMKRNAAIVAGNQSDPAVLPGLIAALQHAHPMVRGAVVWSLQQFHTPVAREALAQHRLIETDPTVLAEFESASDASSITAE